MPLSNLLPANGAVITRRSMLLGTAALGIGALGACGNEAPKPFNTTDVSGAVPDFAFRMTRVDDGAEVTAADYLGKVTLLYFGYTFCPDICPTTLANVAEILGKLGKDATDVRFLFVTVDPNRDTPEVLKAYVDAFGDNVDGLRGTPDQLTELARRYRVSYSVTPKGDDFEVTHSSAIYVFDKKGKARLLVSSLSTAKPDIEGTVDDIRRLVGA